MYDLAFPIYLSANDFSQMEGGLINKKQPVRALAHNIRILYSYQVYID